MVPDNIQGIPSHPLFVHLPVVLIPLIGLSALAMIFWPPLRSKVGWITVGLSAITVVAIQLAMESGESLESRLPHSELIEAHSEFADLMRVAAILLFILLVVFMLIDRRLKTAGDGGHAAIKPSRSSERILAIVVSVLLGLTAVGANVRIYQLGHSGAKAVWHETPTKSVGQSGSSKDD